MAATALLRRGGEVAGLRRAHPGWLLWNGPGTCARARGAGGVSYAPVRARLDAGELVVLDGAIGTEILRREVTWADHQLQTRPELVRSIHSSYLAAGADVISSNTFQLSRRGFMQHFKDAEHMRHIGASGLETRWAELVQAGVRLAQEARQAAGLGDSVAVAGAMTTLEWCFRPDLAPSGDAADAEYRELASVFAEAGCDLLLIETVNSVREAVAAARAARAVGLPCWIAFVPDEAGNLFSGETLAQACAALEPLQPDALLVNCAPPSDIALGLRQLVRHSSAPVGIYPHIGRFDPPEWMFTDEYPPPRYLELAREWLASGARIIGGCCGTTPEHIAQLSTRLRM
ncbi:MAG: homocysteine S-methyltransferase family protein [Chloroflexi bacterium]|nr:MAG: homocysteine S-methyltransferase family protein [Chloroflexota bacterium]